MMFFNIHTYDLKSIIMTILHWMLKSIDIPGKSKESTHLRSYSSLYFYGLIFNLVAMAGRLMSQFYKTLHLYTSSDDTGFFIF